MDEAGSSGAGLSAATETAWSAFEARLTERIQAMEPDEIELVELMAPDDLDGVAPYVQLCCWGDEGEPLVRLEASSNHYLDERFRLDEEQCGRLAEVGFRRPSYTHDQLADEGSTNWFCDAPRCDSAELASMVVTALREVYGVAHPAFLEAGGLLDEVPVEGSATTRAAGASSDEPLAVEVESPMELEALVAEALKVTFGDGLVRDSDGDYPVKTEVGMFWIRQACDEPALDLFAWVAHDLRDRSRALMEVNQLNVEDRYVAYMLRGGTVQARMRVGCSPFSGLHVRAMVEHMTEAIDTATPRLSERLVAGEPEADPAAELRRRALHTLQELTRAEFSEHWGPQLTAEVVVGICEGDRATVLALLRLTSRQLTACRRKLGHDSPKAQQTAARVEAVLRRQRSLLREALLTLVCASGAMHDDGDDVGSSEPEPSTIFGEV